MNVPQNLSDSVFDGPTVPTLFGTPPQMINSTLDLNTAKLAVYSSDCVLCAGTTSFDVSMSSTVKVCFRVSHLCINMIHIAFFSAAQLFVALFDTCLQR